MPLYLYKCEDAACGAVSEQFVHSAEGAPVKVECLLCAGDSVRAIALELGGRAFQKGSGRQMYPFVSRSCGVHPKQVKKMLRRFPHHRFTDKGDMVFDSFEHRKQCLREIGMVDHDGNQSGRD